MTWQDAKVVARTEWAEDLWTMRLDRKLSFAPGQFVNLGLERDGELVRRSYSLASAPGALAEFYVVKVENGALTPALYSLAIGDTVGLDDAAQGFFTLEHVPTAQSLWLVSTGTGLGPFISLIRSGQLWPRFEHVVVVHGARVAEHLGYRDELEELARHRPLTYVPMLTRERHEEILHGRIPANIESGVLEKAARLALSPASAHVMLCGNPLMITDAMAVLAKRDMHKHRVRKPGHITTEKYW